MKIQYNVQPVKTLEDFVFKKALENQGSREVFFVRALGEFPGFSVQFLEMERKFEEQVSYIRLKTLPLLREKDEIAFYVGAYEQWESEKKLRLRKLKASPEFEAAAWEAYRATLQLYQSHEKNVTESMVRNFAVNLLYWLDCGMHMILAEWAENRVVKVVGENVTKTKEYLFYYFLTRLGCDVLLLERKEDVKTAEPLKQLSASICFGPYGAGELPAYQPYLPPMPKKVVPAVRVRRTEEGKAKERREKNYEELARLASSVVMISIHNTQGEIIGTGSGIMIGEKGYILTNDHVACGGSFYSVRIEEEEKSFQTDEIIKYNQSLDLAVIRIPRILDPLPLYSGETPLVRGQKVVAIGSPLGLFNSVSDGIISGFRKVGDVDMIQFTAPISHGSSGGAILNMYGEVIGISTAVFAEGQNINLAVGYENIRTFAQGFLGNKEA